MKKVLFAAVLSLVASVTHAEHQPLPALYEVTNVDASDVLNIRAEPNAASDIIGHFDWNAKDIEVIRLNESRTWAMVALPEQAGWVAFRYLIHDAHEDQLFPFGNLNCGGTEPFWSLRIRPGEGAAFSTPDIEGDQEAPIDSIHSAAGMAHGPFLVNAASAELNMSTVIDRQLCSDGMSDRPHGLKIYSHIRRTGQPDLFLTGCCSLK